MKNFKNILLLTVALSASTACQDFLEPSVDQALPTDTAVQSVDDLKSLVLGIHDRMNAVALYGRDMYVSGDVMSDNAFANGNTNRFLNQENFDFITANAFALGIWQVSYSAIANANIVINADVASTPEVDYAKGQAYALRAMNHLNLVMWFGQQHITGEGGFSALGVPYVKTYATGNLYPSRLTVQQVFDEIIADLNQAVNLMQAETTTASLNPGITQMNYYAVKALQSRAYLYAGRFADAIDAADVVINSGKFSVLPAQAYFDAWVAGTGPSSLFELAFVEADRPLTDNIARIYRNTNYGDVEATPSLYNSYATSDVRRTLFEESPVGTFRMVNKYVDELGTDNVRVIRYEEVLLNKAEAMARSNNAAGALAIINQIATVRGGNTYTTGTLDNVLNERRLELAMEGFRFFDLARNGRSIDISEGIRNVPGFTTTLPFGNYRYALPIPLNEMNANSNMVQNKGYGNQ